MTVTEKQILDSLQKARQELLDEQEEAMDQVRQQFAGRITKVDTALGLLQDSAEADLPEVTVLSISDEKLAAVRSYIERHGKVRQASIAQDLKLNSGTVSVALRKLQSDGLVAPGGKEHGSRIWAPVSVLAAVS